MNDNVYSIRIMEAARMNESAYVDNPAHMPHIQGWQFEGRYDHAPSGLNVCRWRSDDGRLYLAVRGTTGRPRDIQKSLLVFLGHNPRARMDALIDYIQRVCPHDLQQGRLGVGGHSIGGLVASAAAAKWALPGLIQNAPGWMTDPPDPKQLSRLLSIHTSRDTIADWGTPVPRRLLIQLPHIPTLGIGALHAIKEQNKTLQVAWYSQLDVDTPELMGWHPVPPMPVQPGVRGMPSRIARAWRLLQEALTPSEDASAPPQESKPSPVRIKPPR